MAAEAFKVVSWSPNDPITDGKLDSMVSNDNWLKRNMVRGLYSAHSRRRDEGIRIASGLALITSRPQHHAVKQVGFGGFFSDGCRPIVTTGIVSKQQRRIWCTIDGIGEDLHPNRNGFQVHVVVSEQAKKDDKIKRNFYVSWVAVGY